MFYRRLPKSGKWATKTAKLFSTPPHPSQQVTYMSLPPPPEGPLPNGDDLAAQFAAQWAALPAPVAEIVSLLPEYARTILVQHLSEYAALDGHADAMTRWGRFGQVAGRIGAALERDEISSAQCRRLMDYVRGLG